MYPLLLSTSSFPRAILHIDGDAFFASCEQSRDPKLRGRPVVTGKERGIASSMSYEAKARGVTRAMSLRDIKKICPDVVILPSDYETYSLLSRRFYSIVRRWTPDVEEYGIDECFADLTGLRRPLRMSYQDIAENIKREIDAELGFTFSCGLGPNKVVAKIGSKWKKPSGLTIIPARRIHTFIAELPVEKVWGIGPQTTAHLATFGIVTALDFAIRSEEWVTEHFTKPTHEIWRELNGHCVYALSLEPKTTYASIQKFKTFTPPSNDREFVFSQLSKNIENACIKARRYSLSARSVAIYLRTQDFRSRGTELKLSRPSSTPTEIIALMRPHFENLFTHRTPYRQTGICLLGLDAHPPMQLDLFGHALHANACADAFNAVDTINARYGKHKIFLGSSWKAHVFGAHKGDRGDTPTRHRELLPGETQRRRLAIPMFLEH